MSAPSRGAPIKTRATIVNPEGAIHPSPGQRPGNQGAVTTSSPEGAVNSQEGYRKFLQTYAVHYDERYAWD